MIIDLDKFIREERPHWDALERSLGRMERDLALRLSLEEVQEFHYLYHRASADLAKVTTFSGDAELRRYLESLVARAYAQTHESGAQHLRFVPRRWVVETFPRTVRRHASSLGIAAAAFGLGAIFGVLVLLLDPESKPVLMPFDHLHGSPSERVAWEENREIGEDERRLGSFASFLMTHNIRVSVLSMALGVTWAVGPILLLFYNGAVLGAVSADYVADGQTTFLLGWLLPHGSVELPAFLLAGQAGVMLGWAIVGYGTRDSLRLRLRAVAPDFATLFFGVSLLLVWAALIESFLSQLHEPALPYALKVGFGAAQLGCLAWYLGRCGREPGPVAQGDSGR